MDCIYWNVSLFRGMPHVRKLRYLYTLLDGLGTKSYLPVKLCIGYLYLLRFMRLIMLIPVHSEQPHGMKTNSSNNHFTTISMKL